MSTDNKRSIFGGKMSTGMPGRLLANEETIDFIRKDIIVSVDEVLKSDMVSAGQMKGFHRRTLEILRKAKEEIEEEKRNIFATTKNDEANQDLNKEVGLESMGTFEFAADELKRATKPKRKRNGLNF